jgi:hypothetical protein
MHPRVGTVGTVGVGGVGVGVEGREQEGGPEALVAGKAGRGGVAFEAVEGCDQPRQQARHGLYRWKRVRAYDGV